MEQMALALRMAAQKLRPYFQAHPITVLTNQPLRNVLHKSNISGRMLQWAIELKQLEQSIRLGFPASNNEAEYEVILSGLGEWAIEKIPMIDNMQADALAGIAVSFPVKESMLLPIYVQATPGIAESFICNTVYLRAGTLPEDPKHAHQTRVQAARFTLIGDGLYRQSFESSYLRCLTQPKIQYVMSELYEDICGNHSGIAHRTHSQGYYWPTMKKDTEVYAKKCDKCQRYAPVPHMPAETLNLVTSPWPFTQWGMDIVGPLPTIAAQKKFLLVATDYFSKWVEAEAYASIKDKDVTKFIWKNIACRFGIPQTIIADNGPQFDSSTFKTFCSELNIKNLYYTPRYPQSDGQAEATNKTLLSALKKRLEKAKGNTPFALAYGVDAVIPTEIGLPTAQIAIQGQRNEDMELARHLDCADETREAASVRMAAYQQKSAAYYNKKVRPRF
ncbi:hypothetical protein AAG906_038691 [Vitis piasezkii]